MTDRDVSERKTSLATYALAAGLAGLAGFGAVYVSSLLHGNGGPDAMVTPATPPSAKEAGNVRPAAPAPAASQSAAPGANAVSGLNTGAMTAFVVKAAPEALPTFTIQTADGTQKAIDGWRGKVVLMNVWATWCAPCREEMPALNRLQADLGGPDFEVVAISTDRGGADKPTKFLKDVGADKLALYMDPTTRLSQTLRSVGMPTTLLLDREGRELGRLVGPADWGSDDAKRLIQAAIEGH